MNEQASAWKLWQQNPCWKEFLEMIEQIKKESVRDDDSVSIENLNVAVVAQNKGIRLGLTKLLRRIDEKVESK